ncbi:hypothetical protein [Shivajiella indica]|uniref:PorT family protein n=1 Tax=Shivajiella indica TaxID=872115 RepID=A0ABW5B7M1_9BACT
MKILNLFIFLFLTFAALNKAFPLADSVIVKENPMKIGVRFSPSFNFFDYGNLPFVGIRDDYKIGTAFGIVFDWNLSPYNNIRLEPYLELQNLVNNSTTSNLPIQTRFRNIGIGLDAIPLVLKFGGRIKPQVSFGGHIKYIFNSKHETTLDEDLIYNFSLNTNNLLVGINYGIGTYFGKRLIEIRYYQGLNEFVSNSKVPNSINQIQLILIY